MTSVDLSLENLRTGTSSCTHEVFLESEVLERELLHLLKERIPILVEQIKNELINVSKLLTGQVLPNSVTPGEIQSSTKVTTTTTTTTTAEENKMATLGMPIENTFDSDLALGDISTPVSSTNVVASPSNVSLNSISSNSSGGGISGNSTLMKKYCPNKGEHEQVQFQVGSFAKGYLIMHGFQFISGKVNLKLPKFHGGKLIETKLNSSSESGGGPLVLPQLQRALNHTTKAMQILTTDCSNSAILGSMVPFSNICVNNHETLDKSTFTPLLTSSSSSTLIVDSRSRRQHQEVVAVKKLIENFEELMGLIQQSIDQISFAEPEGEHNQIFSSTIASWQQKFSPPIPGDIFLSFHVEEYKIKVTLCGITFPNTTIPNTGASNSHMNNNVVSILHPLKGVIGYLSEVHTTTAEVAFLRDTLVALRNAFKLCVRTRNLLLVHRNYKNVLLSQPASSSSTSLN